MAENPIRKEDIIDIEGVSTGLRELVKLLNVVLGLMDSIKKQAGEASSAINALNPTNKADQQQLAVHVEQTRQLKESYTELENLKRKIERATSKEAIEEEKLRQKLAELNRERKKSVEIETLAEGSLKKMRIQLSQLKEAYARATPEVAQKMIPAINKLTESVTKAEKAIGVHQRGVGNYKNSIKEAAQELGIMVGGAGVAIGVLNKLKDAFLETEQGAGFFKRTAEGLKTFFQGLIQLDPLALPKAIAATKIAKEAVDIRRGDRIDLVTIAKLESQIAKLRYESADATLSEAKQLESLTEAMRLEDELIQYKIKDKQEDIRYYEKMIAVRSDDVTLLNEYYQALADLEKIDSERSLRILSRQSQLRKKLGETKEIIDLSNAGQLKGLEDISLKTKDLSNLETKRSEYAIKANEAIMESNRALMEYEEEMARKRIESIFQYLEIFEAASVTFGNILEKRKQKELSAVGDNAAAREKIEKEYAEKEKRIAISSAIIKGAEAIVRQFADLPFIAALITSALTAATTATQIGIINSQKFAEGGYTGDGSVRDNTGERVAGIVHEREYVIPKEPTRKYRGLLEAIHQDNPMAIADELRNRQFHTVWGGVQPKLTEAQRQDPYTKMMYELMKNSVTTYEDSNGDTVLRFADGSTRVIRK